MPSGPYKCPVDCYCRSRSCKPVKRVKREPKLRTAKLILKEVRNRFYQRVDLWYPPSKMPVFELIDNSDQFALEEAETYRLSIMSEMGSININITNDGTGDPNKFHVIIDINAGAIFDFPFGDYVDPNYDPQKVIDKIIAVIDYIMNIRKRFDSKSPY